jgi:hypothetical protein
MMQRHLADVAAWVESRRPLNAGDVVIDVGSNDGTLLKSYAATGLTRIGVDAVAGKFRDQYPADVMLHEGFFNADDCDRLSGGRKAKAITSISMFYDLESPREFVAAVKSNLASDGIWVLEQSYLPTMLKANSYDTVCHEHLEYYALRQIEWLAESEGLRVFDVELNDANGGSFRLAVCHAESSFPDNKKALNALRQHEIDIALGELSTYKAFEKRVDNLRKELVQFIDGERAKGKRVFVYGASTKGNTLLQYCGLDSYRISAAAERNAEKWGCRTPGTGIPIISEEEARASKPDYFLVLPWHFRSGFIEREAVFLANGGKLIFPLPNIEIV